MAIGVNIGVIEKQRTAVRRFFSWCCVNFPTHGIQTGTRIGSGSTAEQDGTAERDEQPACDAAEQAQAVPRL